MAYLVKHSRYYGSWVDSSSLQNSYSVFGTSNDKNNRSVFEIKLGSLSSGKQRTNLTVDLKIHTVSASTVFTDSLVYFLTDSSYGAGYQVRGNEYSRGSSASFNSKTDYANEISLNIDTSSVPSGTNTVYLWIYASPITSGRYTTYTCTKFTLSEGEHTTVLPSKTSVTTGSIDTATEGFYKPTQSVNLSWSAGSNGAGGITIRGYKARIGYTKDDGSVVHFTSNTTPNLSVAVDIQNIPRGKSITAGVKAFGSEEGYDGSWKDITLGKINNLPTITSVTSTGTKITDDESITFTASIDSGDKNQTAYLEYDLNGLGWKRIESGSKLEIDKSFSGLNTTSSNNTIKFRVNDDVETAQYDETFNFVTSYKPVLSNHSVSFSRLKNMYGNVDSYLTKFVNGTYTASGSVNIKAEIITDSSSEVSEEEEEELSPKDISYAISVFNSSAFQLDVTKLSESDLSYGHYFKFRFAVTNAEGSSDYTQWYGPRRRPKLPKLPTDCEVSNMATDQYGTIADSEYFETSIKVIATNPTQEEGYAQISSISLILNNNTQKPLSWNSSITDKQTVEYPIGDEINNNAIASFVFITTDEAGQSAQTRPFGKLKKSSGLNFTGTANINPVNIRPLINVQDFIIYHPYASDTGSSIAYRYKFSLNKTTAYLIPDSIDDEDQNEKTVTIYAKNINDYLLEKISISERDRAYEGELVVSAVNGFGTEVKLTGIKFYANFLEPPVFNSQDFKIGHDFNVNGSSPTSLINEVTSSLTSSHENRLFNYQEGIIFALPKATDPNGDFEGYNIYLARQDMVLNGNAPSYENVNFSNKPWLHVPINGLNSNNDYYFYRHSMSQLAKNEYLYFQVKAVDATGLESDDAKPFKSYLIGCRTMPASFNVDTKVSRGQNKVTVDYKINITDLGGSAPSSGWSKEFYNAYKNFERPILEYDKSIKIKIEFSDNPNFTIAQVQTESTSMVGKNLLDYTGHNADGSGYSSVSFDTSEEVSKIYIRFTLDISYSLEAYISSLSKVDTNFGEVPTVSHRAHRVGINTNSVDNESVFVVESYGASRKKVKFIGTNSEDASLVYTIEFDLSTGTITGTKIEGFVVDGGSW